MEAEVLSRLYSKISLRQEEMPEGSYTAELFKKGSAGIAQKVSEEAAETVIAFLTDTPERTVSELADLFYHLLVLMKAKGIDPELVFRELKRRMA